VENSLQPVEEDTEPEVAAEDLTEELLEEVEQILQSEAQVERADDAELADSEVTPIRITEAIPDEDVEPAEVMADKSIQSVEPSPLITSETQADVLAGPLNLRLASQDLTLQQRSGFQAMWPWLVSSVILAALGFAVYRKMMVR